MRRSRASSLRVAEVAGSVEALDKVNNRELDVALVQGGLDSRRWTNVTQVAALNLEPLQLVVRSELALEVEANLRALKGHSINLSEVDSGSHALASEVLAFAGLRGPVGGFAGRLRRRDLEPQASSRRSRTATDCPTP